MSKTIEIAKKISTALDNEWLPELEENNLHLTFGAIYNLPNVEIEDKNRIVCFIIYAYSPDSLWLDLKKDRHTNKKKILDSLGANTNADIYKHLLVNNNEICSMCIFNYLEELKDWRWPVVFNLLDYSSKMQRFANKDTESEKSWDEINKEGQKETLTEEVDMEKVVKINKQKGDLLQMAIDKRRQADALLKEMEKDFLSTDIATQADFLFKFTETAKKKDILSWRTFIRDSKQKGLLV